MGNARSSVRPHREVICQRMAASNAEVNDGCQRMAASNAEVNDGVAKLYGPDGSVIAELDLRSTSTNLRMTDPMNIRPLEFLESSEFQRHYAGDGTPTDVKTEEMIAQLLMFGCDLSWTWAWDGSTIEFMDTDGDFNMFRLNEEKIYHRTSESSPVMEVTNIVHDPQDSSIHVVFAGLEVAYRTKPMDDSQLTYEKLYAMVGFADIKHNLPVPAGRLAALMRPGGTTDYLQLVKQRFDELDQQYNLSAPNGALVLYTSDAHVGGQKFYRLATRALGCDHGILLKYLIPYIKRVNFYVNDTRHDSVILFSGGHIGDVGYAEFEVGQAVRVPRLWSTSADLGIAEQFKTDVMFKVHLPDGFWGARSVADISEFVDERETVFVAYSPFLVIVKDQGAQVIELVALDKYFGMSRGFKYKASSYTTLSDSQKQQLVHSGFAEA